MLSAMLCTRILGCPGATPCAGNLHIFYSAADSKWGGVKPSADACSAAESLEARKIEQLVNASGHSGVSMSNSAEFIKTFLA